MGLEAVIKPAGSISKSSVAERAKEINGRLPQVSPQCEAIAVVPVYREFVGGRIMNLLEDLQAQNVGSRRFETVLVVNNPLPSDVSGLAGLVDNLKFLIHIDEQKKAGNFPNVHVLDCSSGEIPKRHMGLVRGLGQLVAEERLDQTETGDKGIIVQLDADVSVDPDFVAKLLEAYQDPWVHSAMIGRIPLPMDYRSDDYYLTYATKFAEAVLSNLQGEANFLGDGPTLSLRASRHKEYGVRRYIDRHISEDFELGEALSESGRLYLLAEPRVYKGDRIRPDGFDSIMRDAWVKIGPTWKTAEALIRHVFKGLPVTEGQFKSMPQSEFWQLVAAKLTENDPENATKLQAYLAREEELGRRAMDWDNLNPQLRDQALHLYAFSRLAMGERQMLFLPAKSSSKHDFKSIISMSLENKLSFSKIYQPLVEQSQVSLGSLPFSYDGLSGSHLGNRLGLKQFIVKNKGALPYGNILGGQSYQNYF